MTKKVKKTTDKAADGAPSLDRVYWIDRGWQNVYIGLCLSEKAWNRQLRKMEIDPKTEPYPTASGNCSTFRFTKEGKTISLVTIDASHFTKHSGLTCLGLLVHELAHVWQAVLEDMNEKNPSIEFEAYALQALFVNMAWALKELKLVTAL